MSSSDTTRMPDAYFESIYARDVDPWGFDTRWYETRKYALTLAALPRHRYQRAFEPGCANGALTERLADRCESLISADVVPVVAARARDRIRTRGFSSRHVDVRALAIPDEWPEGSFDLIVLSEVVYYLTTRGVAALLTHIDRSLRDDGHVIAVHWTGPTDYALSGAEAHALLDKHPGWSTLAAHHESDFLLTVYGRGAGKKND